MDDRRWCSACDLEHEHARPGVFGHAYRPSACIDALTTELRRSNARHAAARHDLRIAEDLSVVVKDQRTYIAILEEQLKPYIGTTAPVGEQEALL